MGKFEELDNKDGFYIQFYLPDTDAASSARYGIGHQAKAHAFEVMSWSVRWGVASISGTVALEKVPSGTAKGSGTVISNSQSTAGTANVPVSGTLLDTQSNGVPFRSFLLGDSLAIKPGGTLTNAKDLLVTVYCRPLGRGGYI